MAITSFAVTSSDTLSAQPDSGGEALILRSDNTGDTTQSVTVSGDVSSAADSESVSLDGKVEQETTKDFESLSGLVLSAACTGVVSVYAQGTAATGSLRLDTQPTDGETLIIGLTTETRTYTFKTTLTPVDAEVKIGASLAETADNLASCINDSSTGTSTPVEATDYQATAADPIFSAARTTGAVVDLTDRIAVARSLTYSMTTGTYATAEYSVQGPTGGVTGTFLASIAAASTEAFNSFTFNDPDLTEQNLPGKVAPTTDSIFLNGNALSIWGECENVTSAITLKAQVSTDGTNWTDANDIHASNALTNLDNNVYNKTLIDTAGNVLQVGYVRLVITANANTTASGVHLAAIYG